EVIILDHHEPGPELPNASVIVNPKQAAETASFKTLCAGGIVYRVIEGLFTEFKVPAGQEKWFLDLAALATVCDMVPLRGDNRLIVHFGLKTLQNTRRQGLRELINTSAGEDRLSAEVIGFRLGPKLNAAGRLEHAKSALDLMLTTSPVDAITMTEVLGRLNRERQQHTRRVVEAATLSAQADLSQQALVLSNPDWPAGVCGLAAGKLAERYNRPVFVLSEGDQCVGSGRSVPGVDLAAAIEAMRPLFIKAGGHAAAAGCTLKRANLNAFRQALVAFTVAARGSALPPRTRTYNLEIPLEDVSLEFLDMQRRLEPFGMDNPRPSVRISNCTVTKMRRVGADQRHMSLTVGQGKVTRRAIAFGQAGQLGNLTIGSRIDLLAQVQQNDWGGRSSAELQIIDTIPV
ncbi:MAG: DHHA1 domain-containing protein, partial [bacterium]|nr:DHHA1 domain-containing protein [bacterium]